MIDDNDGGNSDDKECAIIMKLNRMPFLKSYWFSKVK